MEKYLVTGGAGFIGSHIVEALVKHGNKVRVLDNLTTGLARNLEPFRNKIEFIHGDLRNDRDVKKAVKGVTYIFHLAAIRAVFRSVEDPMETNDVNVTGILRLLNEARRNKVKRIVYSSSCAVYGDAKTFPIVESTTTQPLSPYAASKLIGEHYCQIYTKLYGLETVSLRYFNVFGPHQNPESQYSMLIPIFIQRLLENKPPEIHWDGKQSRDFIYVGNVVHANLLAMKATRAAGEIFNIGTEEEFSVVEIFNLLKKILKKPTAKPIFVPKRPGDVRRTLADISKARKSLKYRPIVFFEEGLRKTVEWFIHSGVLETLRK